MTPQDLWPLRWRGPLDESPFRRIEGTPLNCLVVDAGPQVEAFATQALRRGIEVKTLGGAGGIPAAPLAKLPLDSPAPILAVTECEWPKVRATNTDNSTEAGPTGVPWVDSNGWVAQLLSARAPRKTLWLCFDPPKETQFLRPQAYSLAVADAAGHGARWVASTPPGDEQAWQAMVKAVEFFERHKRWREFRPLARFGVLSDFAGENEFTSTEMLNLTARRHQPFLVLDKTKPVDLGGLSAVVYTDQQPPEAALLKKLMAFVANGGLLLIQPKAAKGIRGTASKESHPRFDLLTAGKGRIAVGKEDWSDPFTVAADAHVLMSHRNDVLRLYNHDSCGSYCTVSPDGRSTLVQLFRYAGRPAGDAMSLSVAGRYSTARCFTVEVAEAKPVKLVATKMGVDVQLPEFSAYVAVELGK